jgi:ClpP class serine protease
VPVAAIVLLFALLGLSNRGAQRRRQNERLTAWRKRQSLTYYGAVKETEKARTALEKRNDGTMVVDVIHDISSTKVFVPGDVYPAITFDQATDILEQLRDTDPEGPVDIVLHTLGGYSLAAELVAGALKAHKGKVTAYVPYIAMSGGSMLALASNKIFLGKNALLGPIDTQYGGFPASAYERLLKAKANAVGDLSDTYYLRAITAIDAEEDARTKAQKMLGESVANFFLDTRSHHGSGIDYSEAVKVLGDRIKNDCPKEVYAFVNAKLAALRGVQREIVGKTIEGLIGSESEGNKESKPANAQDSGKKSLQ